MEVVASAARDLLLRITEEEILVLHRRSAVAPHAGAGVRSERRVRDLVSILRSGAARGESPGDIIAKVFASINRDPQPFNDCNHRTAMAIGRLVARAFDLKLRCTEADLRKLRRDWEEVTLNEFRVWVSARLVLVPGKPR